MLKEVFLNYQKQPNNNELFLEVANALKPKILSIYKTINCPYCYKDYFVQDCYLKIVEVVLKKTFDEEVLNDKIISAYFERAFKTVRQQFIKEYDLYKNYLSLDNEDDNGNRLIDKVCFTTEYNIETAEEIFIQIEEGLSQNDKDFMHLFINYEKNKIRSKTEVAKLLGVSHQAISKKFDKIKKRIKHLKD